MAAPSNTSYRLEQLDPLRSANLVQIKSVAVVPRSHWGKIPGYSQVNPQCKWIKKEEKKGLWPFRLLHDPGPIQVQTGSIHRSDCWSADPGYFFGHPLTQRPDLGYPGINPVWKGNYIGFYLIRSLFLRDNFDLLFPLGSLHPIYCVREISAGLGLRYQSLFFFTSCTLPYLYVYFCMAYTDSFCLGTLSEWVQ